MYIVMKNSAGCELDRKQVFHDESLKQAFLKFVEKHVIEPGIKYEVVDNED